MRTPPVALTLVVTAALLAQTGCGGLTQNHKRGMAFLGGVAVLVGGTLVVDGISCDDNTTWGPAQCDEDQAAMRDGLIMLSGGAALLGFALWELSRSPEQPAGSLDRTAAPRPQADAAGDGATADVATP
ncbi:MAG: hypothetical protein H6709_17695 [Kofleriaceae bacterium]|nr:hypothetical protein [Myxococcales bacterium]MCB9564680.1 hypothetical protein [Kofleriaceae bacterium]MCB9573918.1 hypothetical protein [Kofleriaceae bacterium]